MTFGSGHALSAADIRQLFDLLNQELVAADVIGELYVVGGAVMCLAFNARASTRDVDAYFKPSKAIREAAVRVARQVELPDWWLNDAVKSYLGTRGEYDAFLELSHLRVFIAQPAYLLAMKCMAMRLGEEFHDLDDVRYLLRSLNIATTDEALAVVARYFELDDLPVKTRLALEELLPQ